MSRYVFEPESDRARNVVVIPFLIIVLIGALGMWIEPLDFLREFAYRALMFLIGFWMFMVCFNEAIINFINWLSGKD